MELVESGQVVGIDRVNWASCGAKRVEHNA
jgi:hypothetical protein